MSRQLPLLLLLVASCHTTPPRSSQLDAAGQDPLAWTIEDAAACNARYEQIASELDTPTVPTWAGIYYDRFSTTRTTIAVAPAGVVYDCSGCFGRSDLNYGSIREVKSDRLVVDFEIDTQRNHVSYDDGVPRPVLSSELCFVDWGDRRYLIPSTQMITFCNSVNDGSVASGKFALREEADEDREHHRIPHLEPALGGRPTVPAEWREYLLDRPVVGSIRALLGGVELEPGFDEVPMQTLRASIDAGHDHGLRTEMRIWIPGKSSWIGQVVEVAAQESTVIFRRRDGQAVALPAADDMISTKARASVRR